MPEEPHGAAASAEDDDCWRLHGGWWLLVQYFHDTVSTFATQELPGEQENPEASPDEAPASEPTPDPSPRSRSTSPIVSPVGNVLEGARALERWSLAGSPRREARGFPGLGLSTEQHLARLRARARFIYEAVVPCVGAYYDRVSRIEVCLPPFLLTENLLCPSWMGTQSPPFLPFTCSAHPPQPS